MRGSVSRGTSRVRRGPCHSRDKGAMPSAKGRFTWNVQLLHRPSTGITQLVSLQKYSLLTGSTSRLYIRATKPAAQPYDLLYKYKQRLNIISPTDFRSLLATSYLS